MLSFMRYENEHSDPLPLDEFGDVSPALRASQRGSNSIVPPAVLKGDDPA